MTFNFNFLYLAVIAAFFVSCTTSKKSLSDRRDQEDMQHVMMDTMRVHADQKSGEAKMIPEYKGSRERTWDLIHTSLDLSFDWPAEAVIGKANLTLTPVFYSQSSLQLDAVNFEIHTITIESQIVTEFENTGQQIIIPLTKEYRKDEILNVEIQYTARPRPSKLEAGAAITSDQGLFFIDPLDTIPELPQQIWTQGETSNNSKWFPTLDQPNERGTQEIKLTVSDTLLTLSNGLLVSSTPLENGMRKDHWKLDLPHAPYLAMIAVGQWDKVTDYWRGRPVDYYVDPGYGPSARSIFSNTTEMMDFFSKKLDYDFVWPKYAQVIVKNFVSGAMENTTAVVFGDFIQFHQEDVIEEGLNDYIVSHELFHHWFGNLVTCESWAQLTLNEGFANYAEYLWQEHKYDRERADLSRLDELSGYYDQAAYDAHPLIHHHYAQENQMFDAHSYNKGGLVLHMLRDVVGEEAFFSSLKLYLQRHAYSAAEVHDLRQAFEEVTGKDLHWFFEQWYYGIGHPVLEVQNTYDASTRKLNVSIQQVQKDQGFTEVFTLPIEVAIFHEDSTLEIQRFILKEKTAEFSFNLNKPPLGFVIDPRDILLAVVRQDVPESEYALRATSALSINHRISALRLMEEIEAPVIDRLMMDSSYTIRAMLISHLVDKEDAVRLYQMALREKHPEIQFYILESLMNLDAWKAREMALHLLEHTKKNLVIYMSLLAIAEVDVEEAARHLSHFQNNTSSALLAAKAVIYAKIGDLVAFDFFTSDQVANIQDDYLEEFIQAMTAYLSKQSPALQDKGIAFIDSEFFLKTKPSPYRRFYLITGMLRHYMEVTDSNFQLKILETVKSLYHKETNEYLKSVLKDGLGELLD